MLKIIFEAANTILTAASIASLIWGGLIPEEIAFWLGISDVTDPLDFAWSLAREWRNRCRQRLQDVSANAPKKSIE